MCARENETIGEIIINSGKCMSVLGEAISHPRKGGGKRKMIACLCYLENEVKIYLLVKIHH